MKIRTSNLIKLLFYSNFIRELNLVKPTVKTFFLISLLFSSFLLTAQFDIGVKAGFGYNKYLFQSNPRVPIPEQGFLPIYNGGILLQYLNDKKLGIQSSIEFTQKGWEEKSTENTNIQFKMDFVQFNFLSLIKFNAKKESGLFIKFGPYIAYSFNSSYTVSGNSDSSYFKYDSLQTIYNKLDYGLRVGLAYKFKINKGSLQLEMLYAQGLYNIMERNSNTIFQSLNQSLFVNVAYTFTLGRIEDRRKRIKKNLN